MHTNIANAIYKVNWLEIRLIIKYTKIYDSLHSERCAMIYTKVLELR